MKHKGFDVLYGGLYPQSYLARIINTFNKRGLKNWRFIFYDMRSGEKQYFLCAKS